MSQADSKEHQAEVSAERVSPIMLNGKASAAAPKLSDNDDNVEMKNMLSSGPDAQLDEDIMQLARLGNIPAIQKLFEAEKFHPTYCDAEGITPLHVYSPNSH
jgi:palmitoyltransferase ZDHHC13/17